MGPPPNYLITRKLIRHFFRRYLPKAPINTQNFGEEFEQAIQQYGLDHSETLSLLEKADIEDEKEIAYRKKITNMRIQQNVMATLKRPLFPYEKKGRFREDFEKYDWTIYDGIKK